MSAHDMTLLLPDGPLCLISPDRSPYVLPSTSTPVSTNSQPSGRTQCQPSQEPFNHQGLEDVPSGASDALAK